jgi:hypothetical protein
MHSIGKLSSWIGMVAIYGRKVMCSLDVWEETTKSTGCDHSSQYYDQIYFGRNNNVTDSTCVSVVTFSVIDKWDLVAHKLLISLTDLTIYVTRCLSTSVTGYWINASVIPEWLAEVIVQYANFHCCDYFFSRDRKENLQKCAYWFCQVCPHATTWDPLKRFSWKLDVGKVLLSKKLSSHSPLFF